MPKFLFKANDDVLSHCTCSAPPALSTGQLDCPWCGCGWLISCAQCGKAFTFGEVRESSTPIAEFGRREVEIRGLSGVTDDEIAEWAEAMAETLEEFDVGDVVVYLDGSYFTVDATDVEFTGYFASHQFPRLPHEAARLEPAHLERVLGDPDYWLQRERPAREAED